MQIFSVEQIEKLEVGIQAKIIKSIADRLLLDFSRAWSSDSRKIHLDTRV